MHLEWFPINADTHASHSRGALHKSQETIIPPPPPPPLSIQYSVYCPTSCTLDRFTIRHSSARPDSLFGMSLGSPFHSIQQSSVSVQCERPRPGNHHLVAVQVSMVSHTSSCLQSASSSYSWFCSSSSPAISEIEQFLLSVLISVFEVPQSSDERKSIYSLVFALWWSLTKRSIT